MDTGYRTGVFYQAMPAVGADGKNIMKLIPVQMVNGQFVQTPTSRPTTDAPPQKPSDVSVTSPAVQMSRQAVFNRPIAEHMTRKHFSQLSVPPSQPNLSINKQPLQQQTANLASKVPQMDAHSAVSGNSLTFPNQLPVTVNSPNLPKGQCLQIPATAQVRTVPASELPPAVKKQIFTSSASSSAGLDSSTVVYISPVTTVRQGVSPHNEVLTPKPLSSTTKRTTCGLPEKVKKPHLKLIPMVSQRPNSPIRWVIEEVEDSAAPHLKPVDLSSKTCMEKKGNAVDHCDVTKPESHLRQDNSEKPQENALVMCNGKVFLLAKKSSLPVEATASTQSSESKKTSSVSSPQRNLRITDEVIDLCDDDAQDDLPQQAAPVTTSAISHQDEDNVIFVSYIPPKSCSTQAPVLNATNQTDSSSCSSILGENGTNVCEAAAMDMTHNTSQQNTSTSQLDSMEVDETADPSEMESSTNPAAILTPLHHQMADHMLRQIFGITSDVKICLQRIDESTALTFPLHAEFIMSMEGETEPASGFKKEEKSHSPQGCQQLSGTPLQNSHITQPSSALLQCLLDPFNRTPRHTETEPVIGYVAPIDEDFPSTDTENNNSASQDAAACPQACAELTTIIRRVGRMRKRTVCPCCIPATLDPGLKSSARLEETETWALISEEATKKGGRTKAPRKDGRRVGCAAAKNKQNCKSHKAAAGDSLSSVDSDEMKRTEQTTQRSPEEKEAALETT